MSQNQQHFEDLIRRTLEDFEVEFNPSHWEEMNSRLNLLGQGVSVSMNTFYGAFVTAAIFMAGLVYFGMPSGSQGGMIAQQEEEQTEEPTGFGEQIKSSEEVNAKTEDLSASNVDTFVMDVPTNKMDKIHDTSSSSANSEKTEAGEDNPKKPVVEYGEMKVKKIKSSVSQGCEGTPITFSTSGKESEGNYLWNFGDGYFSNNQNPVHVFEAPGIFDVSLLVTPLTGGKLTPMTIEDQIKINPRPEASFEYSHQQNSLNIPQVKLKNKSKNVDRVMWVVNDEVVSEEPDAIHNFTNKGTYHVQLVAVNEFGCADTTTQKLVIKEDYNLLAPESFSPNGDHREETFIPGALKLIDGEFVMRVVDPRTDMVIFETTDYNQPWDGKIAGTTVKASSGEYHWMVEVNYSDGRTDQFKGRVKLNK